jgi:hypothetical protein
LGDVDIHLPANDIWKRFVTEKSVKILINGGSSPTSLESLKKKFTEILGFNDSAPRRSHKSIRKVFSLPVKAQPSGSKAWTNRRSITGNEVIQVTPLETSVITGVVVDPQTGKIINSVLNRGIQKSGINFEENYGGTGQFVSFRKWIPIEVGHEDIEDGIISLAIQIATQDRPNMRVKMTRVAFDNWVGGAAYSHTTFQIKNKNANALTFKNFNASASPRDGVFSILEFGESVLVEFVVASEQKKWQSLAAKEYIMGLEK